MGHQLRVVVHVLNASLDSLLVDNETMKRRDIEEQLAVLVLVRLIVGNNDCCLLAYTSPYCTTASSGLPFKFVSVLIII